MEEVIRAVNQHIRMDGFLKKLEAKNVQDAYLGMPDNKEYFDGCVEKCISLCTIVSDDCHRKITTKAMALYIEKCHGF